jgi:hypothetical protein
VYHVINQDNTRQRLVQQKEQGIRDKERLLEEKFFKYVLIVSLSNFFNFLTDFTKRFMKSVNCSKPG